MRGKAAGLAALMCLGLLTACAVDDSAQSRVIVGSGTSVEGQLLGRIYAGALGRAGADVETVEQLGNRDKILSALDDGRVTLVPDTTGALLTRFDPSARQTDPDDVFVALNKSLPEGLSVSDYSMAEVGDSTAGPAENIVPLFRKGSLTAAQVKKLNIVGGELTTADLTALSDRLRRGENSADVAGGWLDDRGI